MTTIVHENNSSHSELLSFGDESFLELVQDMHLGLLVEDSEGRVLFINQSAKEVLGDVALDAPHSSPFGTAYEVVHENSTQFQQDELPSQIARATLQPVVNLMMGIRREAGAELRWVLVNAHPRLSSDGRLAKLIYTLSDVTERRRNVEAINESESRNRAILKAIPDLMFIQTREGVYTDYYAKDESSLIVPPEFFIGKSMDEVLPAYLTAGLRKCFDEAIRTGETSIVEYSLQIDGEWRQFEARVVASDSDKVLSIVRDITDRVQAYETIQQRDQLLQSMFESISSLVAVIDTSGVITYVSRSWENFAHNNYSTLANASLGVNYLEVCRRAAQGSDESARAALSGIESVLAAEVSHFVLEYPCHSKNRKRWFLMHVDPMPPEIGGAVISHTDITERKETEVALQQALKEVSELKNHLQAENIYLREEISADHNLNDVVGSSSALKAVLRQIRQVGPTDSTVLMLGETGTGKELMARAVHESSRRKDRPMIKVNCATLPSNLIESELFGHERGAFTGASTARIGRFEVADGGTIFLDEIGELPLDLQAKLLRVLQEGEFERLGSSKPIRVDVRVIAATNRDLNESVKQATFRADLFYRLNIFPINVPPLRERREDIPQLVSFFVNRLNQKLGRKIDIVSQSTMDALQQYNWPGNIRELQNVIERAFIVSEGNRLELADNLAIGDRDITPTVEPEQKEATPPFSTNQYRKLIDLEREYITEVLKKTYWRIEGKDGAAVILGMNPNTLRSRMRKLGIKRP
jgi:PAS domain S-box-containing protein